MTDKPITLDDWVKLFPPIRTIDALADIWRGWCQDEKCPYYPTGPRHDD